MKIIAKGILAAKGYKTGSVAAGIKRQKLDITVLYSEKPANVAGSFTTNLVKAAPVLWGQKIVNKKESVQALVVNSGNANACTSEQGELDTLEMATVVAQALDLKASEVLVCSTGVIGVPLPMEKIKTGIAGCVAKLDDTNVAADEAAHAILTTDTFKKEVAVEINIGGGKVVIGGMAKGSGMIHPNMATMLSFITTDATVSTQYLQSLLDSTVVDSYNMISVDGDTSTNDTVLAFANGFSKAPPIESNEQYKAIFEEAFKYVNIELAKLVVLDGEGASKFIEVEVKGSLTKEDARLMARSITSSSLVKTAFFGSDANWGRILCAMGYSKANFDPSKVSVTYQSDGGTVLVLDKGQPIAFDEELAKKVLTEKIIKVKIDVGQGKEEATAWGCDLSYDYVRINGDYRS
jgi:glutamate N-acetyltransferase/amino-acid N-acetyltransferase